MGSATASNKHISELSKIDWLERFSKIGDFAFFGVSELYYSVKNKTFPWAEMFFASSFIAILSLSSLDRILLVQFGIGRLDTGSWRYKTAILLLPVFGWVLYRALCALRLRKRLSEIFNTGGLKSATGRIPELISDLPLDNLTRRFRFNRAIFPIKDFDRAKPLLESGLRIYIDEFKEVREQGTVDAVYSKFPMPRTTRIEDIKKIPARQFVIGKTRTKEITLSLKEVPHLLVAGQTGGGKSTFLRQFITTLYLNNSDFNFTLIDLKGGLEFQLFENLKRVEVISTLKEVINRIGNLAVTVDGRMAFLKEKKAKDIEAYQTQPTEEKKQRFDRHVIVVDEAAEIFLTGGGSSSKDIQEVKRVLSRIARLGRSVGVHLVIATQRPDARSLDPQVKTNLVGRLCFQMPNDASSITVLGNGRATDLPSIPGRAIWQCGNDQVEIQTPYLSDDDVDALLADLRVKPPEPMPSTKKALTKSNHDGNEGI